MRKKKKEFCSAFVCVLGKPNVGKSTLINNLIGQKVSIVTDRPQTTRHRILGIKTTPDYQIVFVDTPGFAVSKDRLGDYLLKTVKEEAKSADLILLLIDAEHPRGKGDFSVLDYIKGLTAKNKIPVFLGINKIDLIEKLELLPLIDFYQKEFAFKEIFPISALKNQNLVELETAMLKYFPVSPPYFPEGDSSDQNLALQAAEIIREKALTLTFQELPYGIAVRVEEIREGKTPGTLYIAASLFVERDAHKKMVIGKGGQKLKKIGSLAREELELKLGQKVFLDLWVKIKEDWRNRSDFLKTLGYW